MKTIAKAERFAKQGYIVLFGITPLSANANYGYIKPGELIENARIVRQFVEKPDRIDAQRFVEEGYFWNSGIFVFQIKTLVEEIKTFAPTFATMFHFNENGLAEDILTYDQLQSISIDNGIIEQTDKLVMIPLDVHWNDIDDFNDLHFELPKDANGNVSIFGKLLAADSKNDLVIANIDKLVSLIHLNDMVVVDTDDVLFIAPKKESKHVKEIVKYLIEKKDRRIINGLTVYRPWGLYTILEATETRVIKKIRVFPTHAISLQLHHHRSEHWVVVNGTAKIYVDGKELIVNKGESTFIKPEQRHRLTNPSETEPLEIIEVQLGDWLSEEDIVRFEDMYGRR
jgi:mannose-1-phosphate guanylyltransferase/mannose-6-phosphate isomerase